MLLCYHWPASSSVDYLYPFIFLVAPCRHQILTDQKYSADVLGLSLCLPMPDVSRLSSFLDAFIAQYANYLDYDVRTVAISIDAVVKNFVITLNPTYDGYVNQLRLGEVSNRRGNKHLNAVINLCRAIMSESIPCSC